MSKLIGYGPCPRCRERGRDRRGDNLGLYSDGGSHCFSCGYHPRPPLSDRLKKREEIVDESKAVLPNDFTREVPARGWQWLLKYGLPYSYWKPYIGWSPGEDRLVITHGTPTELSVGRFIGDESATGAIPLTGRYLGTDTGPRKWRAWGDKLRSATILGSKDSESPTVLVEDIISAHKVAQVNPCLPLFGTAIYPKVLQVLRPLKRPVTLWLDEDQYGLLAPKINRLQALLDVPVRFLRTEKDPKSYETDKIKELLR